MTHDEAEAKVKCLLEYKDGRSKEILNIPSLRIRYRDENRIATDFKIDHVFIASETCSIHVYKEVYKEPAPRECNDYTNDHQVHEVLAYCEPHLDQMWAARIASILLNCDFRNTPWIKAKIKEYTDKVF